MTLAGGTNAANARGYVGRFAPSPTGPLHAGSLVAALASWLDARAAQGQWLVRLEDVDTPRCIPGADQTVLHQLERCGLHPDAPPVWQSQRGALYQTALDALCAQGLAYPCACSRKEIEEAHTARGHAKERHAALPYPGTCRTGLHGRPCSPRRMPLFGVAACGVGFFNFFARAGAGVSQPLGAQGVQCSLVQRAALVQAAALQLVEDGLVGPGDAARGIDILESHQPLALGGPRIQPTGQCGHQRACMQWPGSFHGERQLQSGDESVFQAMSQAPVTTGTQPQAGIPHMAFAQCVGGLGIGPALQGGVGSKATMALTMQRSSTKRPI
eukprot:gene44734-55663_t